MASHTLLRFFDNEVPQHCMDEEQHLFPALIDSMAGSDAVCLRALANGSMERHQVLAAQWERLRGSLEHIAAGRLILLPRNEVEAFAAAWTGHVDVEEAELLPMASRLLSDDELVALYRRMQG
jgi:hemerythrin-like domain-containing protein